MGSWGYPELASHHKTHEAFVAEVVAMLGRTGSGDTIDATSLLEVLKEWLVRHIQGTDKKYSAYFAQREGRLGTTG